MTTGALQVEELANAYEVRLASLEPEKFHSDAADQPWPAVQLRCPLNISCWSERRLYPEG